MDIKRAEAIASILSSIVAIVGGLLKLKIRKLSKWIPLAGLIGVVVSLAAFVATEGEQKTIPPPIASGSSNYIQSQVISGNSNNPTTISVGAASAASGSILTIGQSGGTNNLTVNQKPQASIFGAELLSINFPTKGLLKNNIYTLRGGSAGL
jgi:hypothetical protein